MATTNVTIVVSVSSTGFSREIEKGIEKGIAAAIERPAQRELKKQLDALNGEGDS